MAAGAGVVADVYQGRPLKAMPPAMLPASRDRSTSPPCATFRASPATPPATFDARPIVGCTNAFSAAVRAATGSVRFTASFPIVRIPSIEGRPPTIACAIPAAVADFGFCLADTFNLSSSSGVYFSISIRVPSFAAMPPPIPPTKAPAPAPHGPAPRAPKPAPVAIPVPMPAKVPGRALTNSVAKVPAGLYFSSWFSSCSKPRLVTLPFSSILYLSSG